MSIKYFDADGRCVASFTKNDVYKDSRKYFQLDKNKYVLLFVSTFCIFTRFF